MTYHMKCRLTLTLQMTQLTLFSPSNESCSVLMAIHTHRRHIMAPPYSIQAGQSCIDLSSCGVASMEMESGNRVQIMVKIGRRDYQTVIEEQGLTEWLSEVDGQKSAKLGFTVYGAGQVAVGQLCVLLTLKQAVQVPQRCKKVVYSSDDSEVFQAFMINRSFSATPPEIDKEKEQQQDNQGKSLQEIEVKSSARSNVQSLSPSVEPSHCSQKKKEQQSISQVHSESSEQSSASQQQQSNPRDSFITVISQDLTPVSSEIERQVEHNKPKQEEKESQSSIMEQVPSQFKHLFHKIQEINSKYSVSDSKSVKVSDPAQVSESSEGSPLKMAEQLLRSLQTEGMGRKTHHQVPSITRSLFQPSSN